MPDAGRSASTALALAERCSPTRTQPGSVLFVTDGIDPGDIAAFPDGGSARVALIVAPDGGAEIADWSRRADVATVAEHASTTATSAPSSARSPRASPAPRPPRAGCRTTAGCSRSPPACSPALVPPRHDAALGRCCSPALLAAGTPHGARADGLADWFWTPDQQGRRLYEAHRYAEAAATFADPAWRAAALFRAGKYQEAADLLAPDPDLRRPVQPRHRAGPRPRLPGAKAAFEAALAARPGERGGAAHNLDVTNRIIAYLTEARAGRRTPRRARAARRHRRGPDRRPGPARPHRRRLRSSPRTPRTSGCARSRRSPPTS